MGEKHGNAKSTQVGPWMGKSGWESEWLECRARESLHFQVPCSLDSFSLVLYCFSGSHIDPRMRAIHPIPPTPTLPLAPASWRSKHSSLQVYWVGPGTAVWASVCSQPTSAAGLSCLAFCITHPIVTVSLQQLGAPIPVHTSIYLWLSKKSSSPDFTKS